VVIKNYIGVIFLFIFLFSCKKYEAYPPHHDPYSGYWYDQYSIEGEWLLTSAKRITRHTTVNWGDSINYFWYPTTKFPLKYNRGRIYDSIKVGQTEWIITEDKIYQDNYEFYYVRRNENTLYCDQLQLDFYDTYMVVDIDSNVLILETNKQTDNNSGSFLFDHFTILEFQRINSATIQNTHYYNGNITYCLELNKYDTNIIWNSYYEVPPYHP
tara:strand:+ start:950 stop:1588 length:639 start_codon:yes stop_codon:yes gene_type:complete